MSLTIIVEVKGQVSWTLQSTFDSAAIAAAHADRLEKGGRKNPHSVGLEPGTYDF